MGVLAIACANLPRERFANAGQMEAALKALATGIAVKARDNQSIEITISHQDRTEGRNFSGDFF